MGLFDWIGDLFGGGGGSGPTRSGDDFGGRNPASDIARNNEWERQAALPEHLQGAGIGYSPGYTSSNPGRWEGDNYIPGRKPTAQELQTNATLRNSRRYVMSGGDGWSDWIGPAIGLAGNIYAANSASSAMGAANATNVGMAREQMAFQERMSTTAHQREMDDLRAAGINPLMGSKFGGSSTPGGASATVQPDMAKSQLGRSIGDTVKSAMDAVSWKKDLASKDAQIEATKASAAASVATAANSMASAKATNANMPGIRAKAVQAGLETPAYQAEADLRKKKADVGGNFVWLDAIGNRVNNMLGGISSAVSSIRSGASLRRDSRDETRREESHLNRQGSRGSRVR